MSTSTMVHVRVDEKVKLRATKALAAMGLSVSDAVRVFLTRISAEQRLPFDLHVPNAATRTAMAEVETTLRARHARFATADEIFDDLEETKR